MNVVKRGILNKLSKAFDCYDHNLLIAKLNASRFAKQITDFIYSHLTKCKKERKPALRSVHGKFYFQVCLKTPF